MKAMLDIDALASQVKYNCNISDAQYWGHYSPCGLLLRLRDLYTIEKGMRLWERPRPKNIAQWIGERESLWEEVASYDFQPLEIKGTTHNPFDVEGINSVLHPEGLLYGAGYGHFLKPTFLLAEITREIEDNQYDIFFVGREIARDLSSVPAMLQGSTIIARHHTMKTFLWQKYEEMRAKRHLNILSHAFSEYGIVESGVDNPDCEMMESRIAGIAWEELNTCVYHELGEAYQSEALGTWWKDLVCGLPYSRAELFIRSLKDLLADTCRGGMLDHIITQKKAGSLGFYCALLGGYRKALFREILSAYDEFIQSRDWGVVEGAREKGYRKGKRYIEKLKALIHAKGTNPAVIEKIMKDIMPHEAAHSPDVID